MRLRGGEVRVEAQHEPEVVGVLGIGFRLGRRDPQLIDGRRQVLPVRKKLPEREVESRFARIEARRRIEFSDSARQIVVVLEPWRALVPVPEVDAQVVVRLGKLRQRADHLLEHRDRAVDVAELCADRGDAVTRLD